MIDDKEHSVDRLDYTTRKALRKKFKNIYDEKGASAVVEILKKFFK